MNKIYLRRISEQITAREIFSQKYQAPGIHFRIKEKGEAEVDFLYPNGDMLIPIEVKSGTFGKLKSLLLC